MTAGARRMKRGENVHRSAGTALAAALLFLTGCAEILAVSDSKGPEGGVYRVQAGGAFQCAKVQNLNSLVRGGKNGLFYGTVNRRGGGVVVLDEIPGIGAAKKIALLKKFHSTRGIAKASVEAIAAVAAVNETIATQVKTACTSVGG